MSSKPEGKTVFLDRDGVINLDPGDRTDTGYVASWDDFFFLPSVLKALRLFTEKSFKTVIISNQQGVGKGLFRDSDLDDITDRMLEEVKKAGAKIERVYYCRHLQDEKCACRKPEPGLFEQAKNDLGMKSLERCFYIGDTERDVEAARKAGLKVISVLSGKSSEKDIESWGAKPDIVCCDLMEAARSITGTDGSGGL